MAQPLLASTARFLALALVLCIGAGCGSSIHDDVGRGDTAAVKAKLDADAGVVAQTNELGKTALHYAVSYKRIALMALLVEAGADINAADGTGLTPLHVAAMLGRRDEAAWLLANGADVHARDQFGDTPLLTAAVFGAGGVVKLLTAHGADLQAVNKDGLDAVALARKYHQDKMAAYLQKNFSGS